MPSYISVKRFYLSSPRAEEGSRVVIGMEWKESKTDCPGGNSLGNAVEEELLKYINEQEFLSPEISKPFIELLTWFQMTTLHVSTTNHGPHHKNKCCMSAGDGQQRDITMVIEKAIMNKIDTLLKELDQRITV